MKKCPNCGSEYDNDRFYCLNCGMSLTGGSSGFAAHRTKPKAPPEKKPVESPKPETSDESSKSEPSSQSNIDTAVETAESAVKESVSVAEKNSGKKKKFLIVILISAVVLVTVLSALFGVIISKNGNDRNDKSESDSDSDSQYYQESDNSHSDSDEEQSTIVYYDETKPNNELESVTEPTEPPEESEPEIVVTTQQTAKKTFLICEDVLLWNEAQKKCEEMGGHLAYITGIKEYNSIISELDSMGIKFAWVGAKTFMSGDSITAEWLDGSGMDFVYDGNLWYPGEPTGCDNTSAEKTPEPYVMLCKFSEKWYFIDCSDEFLKMIPRECFCYICETDGDGAANAEISTEVKTLEKPTAQQAVRIGMVMTKDDDLNVRINPDINSEKIGTVAKGSTITITGDAGDWYKIEFNGGVGYVSKDYVDLLDW